MHQEYDKLLKKTAWWREQYAEATDAPTMLALVELAQAENMLEEHARREKELLEEHARQAGETQPSRFARVHMLGHQTHVGEVQQLHGGALLVHAIDSSVSRGVFRYHITAEQKGRHSIEWMTQWDFVEHVNRLHREHEEVLERRFRRTHMPEGFELVERKRSAGVPPYGFRCSAGVNGFWWDKAEVFEAAWEQHDDPHDFEDRTSELDLEAPVDEPPEDVRPMNAAERVDYSKAPPGFAEHSEVNLATAWALHKRQHNPPGMHVVNDLTAYRWRLSWARMEGPPMGSEDEARAAAWDWHDPRHALAEDLERLCADAQASGHGLIFTGCRGLPDHLRWPGALTLTAQQVADARAYLDSKGALRMPEVFDSDNVTLSIDLEGDDDV